MRRSREFWRVLQPFKNTSPTSFNDPTWQTRNSLKSTQQVTKFLDQVGCDEAVDEFLQSQLRAPMATKLTPYILSLIDWKQIKTDPIRKQFLPLSSDYKKDHPMVQFDSLNEQESSPVKGLVHRYPDKCLFLPLSVCPVYCRFCTRSYAIDQKKHRQI